MYLTGVAFVPDAQPCDCINTTASEPGHKIPIVAIDQCDSNHGSKNRKKNTKPQNHGERVPHFSTSGTT